ncbi:flagellin [Clostridiales bacterium PH28_bin88]|nr:flagellin [Clostridiales bacterium PH28_bin88]
MRINTNIAALNSYRALAVNEMSSSKSLEKLSSGLGINKAADNAAGLAISEKMRGQIRGLQQASRNAQDGISLIQTAEGALNETHSILQRMRELAVQAASDTLNDSDRTEIQREVSQLKDEIDRIASNTEFNTKKLLNGDIEGATTAQGTELESVVLKASGGALAVAGTSLEALFDASNNDFGLVDGDVIQINGYKGGTAIATTTFTVTVSATLTSLMTAISDAFSLGASGSVSINPSGEIVISGADGTAAAISNVKLSVADRTLFNNRLSSFTETQSAQDNHTDSSLSIQIGANQSQTISVSVTDMSVQRLALSSVDVSTQTGANNAVTVIDNALSKVSTERAKMGAVQNRLEHTINNLGTAAENLTAAESRVRDVDMALEMAQFTKTNILLQAATAMLAQANQQPQTVLQLLR